VTSIASEVICSAPQVNQKLICQAIRSAGCLVQTKRAFTGSFRDNFDSSQPFGAVDSVVIQRASRDEQATGAHALACRQNGTFKNYLVYPTGYGG
jgi:hypothetical protein